MKFPHSAAGCFKKNLKKALWVVFCGIGISYPLKVALGVELPVESEQAVATALADAKAIMQSKTLTAQERIAALETLRRSSPIAHPFRDARIRPSVQSEPVAVIRKRMFDLAVAAATSENERELAELQRDMAVAVDEMRAYEVSPETRIRMLDDFRRNNGEAYKRIRALRGAITAERLAQTAQEQPTPPVGPQDAAAQLRSAIAQEIEDQRSKYKQLSPQERITALQQLRPRLQARMDSLRALQSQNPNAVTNPR